jgi:hypothetical protein
MSRPKGSRNGVRNEDAWAKTKTFRLRADAMEALDDLETYAVLNGGHWQDALVKAVEEFLAGRDPLANGKRTITDRERTLLEFFHNDARRFASKRGHARRRGFCHL